MEIIVEQQKGACCSTTKVVSEDLATSSDDVKQQVKERYARSAEKGNGCGCGCSDENPFNLDSYEAQEGYVPDADLGLGCGVPTEAADIREGQDVLDLGSGGGIDAFVSRELVGESGTVTGLDFTPEMIALAKRNATKLGYSNVRFVQGDIEDMPFVRHSFDRVISNCVINLVPDKLQAFSEIFRVLKVGGGFTISDIIIDGELPESIRSSAEAYAGCVSGAISKNDYQNMLVEVGFSDIAILKENEIILTDEDLQTAATPQEIADFRASGARIISLTFKGVRR